MSFGHEFRELLELSVRPVFGLPDHGSVHLDLDYSGHPGLGQALVHELNATVIASGGRVYLAKDAVTRAEDFALMVPRLAEWRRVREKWDPGHRFRSAQSVRLLGDSA